MRRLGHLAFNRIPRHGEQINKRNKVDKKKLGYDESSELSNIDPTPKKKYTKLRRSYAIADIAALNINATESEHEPQVLNDDYEPQGRPESHSHVADEDSLDGEPTPKKRPKTIKVPVREVINANRKEREPRKMENKVSCFIVID